MFDDIDCLSAIITSALLSKEGGLERSQTSRALLRKAQLCLWRAVVSSTQVVLSYAFCRFRSTTTLGTACTLLT